MSQFSKIIVLVFFSLFIINNTNASHVSGGSIKYEYLGPGSTNGTQRYKVILGIYRDCNGIRYSTSNERITAVCLPGKTPLIVQTANKVNYIPKMGERPANLGAKDVSDICPSKSSRCAGSGNPGGYEISYYETIFELPACNFWEIYLSPSQCCRNGTANISGSYFAPITRLNSVKFASNSSPNFIDELKPYPSACVGQNISYGIGTADPDGDSLRFEFQAGIDRITSPGVYTFVNYRSGFSFNQPIPGIKLDSLTGRITFKPTVVGKFLVAFWVIEYDRCTGKEKGRTHREVQFDVRNCVNKAPIDISGISNIKGKFKRVNDYTLEVCEGSVLSWEDTIVDPDVNDSIYFKSNVDSTLKVVNWSVQTLGRNKAVVKFSWRARIDPYEFHSFLLGFSDNKCDFPGSGASIFHIKVKPAASAGVDQTICLGDTALISAFGSKNFVWHSISGDPIIKNVNWFPDTTKNDTGKTVSFVPTQTTKLWVEVDSLVNSCGQKTSANCFKVDTILITVVDSFSIFPSPTQFVCNPGSGQLNVNTTKAFQFTYKWSPSIYLNNSSIRNPSFSNLSTPTQFGIKVTSKDGCVRRGNVQVHVTEPFPRGMKIMASDTLVCIQKKIKLWVNRDSINYGNQCNAATYACQGNYKYFNLGKGSVQNTMQGSNMPVIYGAKWSSAKAQYLYTASELRALGMKAGPIRSLGWHLDSIYKNQSTPFNKFTIHIACSNLSDLPQINFGPIGVLVYGPKTFLPTKNWNDHVFDKEYNWDGKSNLIVNVCWENTSNYGGNHVQSFDTKSYRASAFYYQASSFYNPACPEIYQKPGFPSNLLPKTRFNVCTGVRASRLKYSWQPTSSGGFTGPTNKDSVMASVNLGTSKNYTVYVEDSATGICKDTLHIKINVVTAYDTKPINSGPYCIAGGFITLRSKTPWNIAVPGGKWSGAGIVNDSLGLWDPLKSGFGKHWVKYRVTGDACASEDSTQIEFVGLPDVSLLTPNTACVLYGGKADTVNHRLKGRVSGGTFSGFGVDSIMNKSGEYVYYINGTLFNPKPSRPQYAYVKHSITKACAHDTVIKIPVIAPWDSTFMGILYYGTTFSDNTFCRTGVQDTLAVKGANPTWRSLLNPKAMIDSTLGIYDPKLARAGWDTIQVFNNGFCGTQNKFPIFIHDTIEIEVVDKFYCYSNGCSGIPFLERDDSMRVRIPKGPNQGGSTNRLDPNGFNASQELILYRALKANSGWQQTEDNVDFNKWSGDLGVTPQVARFRPCELKNGSYKFAYQFPLLIRSNHPRAFCYSRDEGTATVSNTIQTALASTYNICNKSFVDLDAGIMNNATYQWSDGQSGQKIRATKSGIIRVTVTAKYCTGVDSTELTPCLIIDENTLSNGQLNVFPNPATDIVNISGKGFGNIVVVSVMSLNGTLIQSFDMDIPKGKLEAQIDVSQLPSGTYLLKISGNHNSTVKRLVLD